VRAWEDKIIDFPLYSQKRRGKGGELQIGGRRGEPKKGGSAVTGSLAIFESGLPTKRVIARKEDGNLKGAGERGAFDGSRQRAKYPHHGGRARREGTRTG